MTASYRRTVFTTAIAAGRLASTAVTAPPAERQIAAASRPFVVAPMVYSPALAALVMPTVKLTSASDAPAPDASMTAPAFASHPRTESAVTTPRTVTDLQSVPVGANKFAPAILLNPTSAG